PPGRVLTVATGLGAPGRGCGVPPSAWCQNWVTALRCGALGRCPHLTQGHPDVDTCAVCQQLVGFLRDISKQSAVEVPVLDQLLGALCLDLPLPAPLCRTVVRNLVHVLFSKIQHLEPRQFCATVKLCHGEPGAAPSVPDAHLQGSGGAVLAPEALPVPVPLCWMCRTLVARAE
ncbi:PSPB protein, partial [Pachycephala philippinensis]|nr:PSPB protein [Pachycephala philippinensis]